VSPFVFLLVPVAVVILASIVIYLRGRKPVTLHSGIDDFQREMNALSPSAPTRTPRRFEADGTTPPARRTDT
jgi:hypothetical protein